MGSGAALPESGAPPWAAARAALTERDVRAIVAEQFPSAPRTRVAPVGEGWDFEAWRVDDVVFRFPKRPEAAVQQRYEVAMLSRIGAHLPVAVPEPVFEGTGCEHVPYPFAGYRWIDGSPGDRLMPSRARWDDFAARYGRFVQALQAVPRERLRDLDVRSSDGDLQEVLRGFESEVRSVLSPHAFDRAWRLADVDHSVRGDVVLVHDDLCPEHWLFDEEGRLVAVIDWTDVSWGDPLADWTAVWIWFGEPTLRAALDAARHPDPKDVLARVPARAMAQALTWLGEGVRWPSPDAIPDRAAGLFPGLLGRLGIEPA